MADSASLDLSTGMTLEAWVNPTAAGGFRTVLSKQHPVGGLSYVLYANDAATTPSSYAKINNVDQGVIDGAALPLNTWSHIAATYDGATYRLYVNGVQVASESIAGTIATSSLPLHIGGNVPFGEFFAGLIDDVRIYNRALTAAEIAADMAAAVP